MTSATQRAERHADVHANQSRRVARLGACLMLLCGALSCRQNAGELQNAAMQASSSSSSTSNGSETPPAASAPGSTSGPSAASDPNATAIPVVAYARTVSVTNDAQLTAALAAAVAGDQIVLAQGTYQGPIALSAKTGVALTSSSNALITTTSSSSPCVTLTGCNKCTLTGLTLSGGQKGLMVINTQDSVFDHLVVSQTLMEAVHLEMQSSNNTIQSCVIHDSGLGGSTAAGNGRTQADDGEGIYIGTAISNGAGDLTNNTKILYNKIYSTTAENIDIKEFTSGGLIRGNSLDCNACGAGATANLEIKGSMYTVTDNTIINKHLEGIKQYNVPGAPVSVGTNTISDNQGL